MSTQKHPNNAPAASPSANAAANTAEPSLNRRILALAVPAFGALIAEPIFVLTDSALIGQLGKAELAGMSIAATLVTAASVCVTGMIGWVGLVIPHLCRMLVGADYRRLIPASMLMGASFLLIVDDVARLATTAEIPIGILTAFVGAPFFLYLITRKKKL